ncbi:IS66 family insertion sequence element accessory protein TnpB [Rhodovibrio salinarum]|uniref:IS66 family insertion sequence element accessory protein TnpB n=1 Tax=Rhodovibrio salinarum TaxID=1087 RepID=UPI00190745C0
MTGLAALAQRELCQNLTFGAVFAFRGRWGDRQKLLYWDGQRGLPVLQAPGARRFPSPSPADRSVRA